MALHTASMYLQNLEKILEKQTFNEMSGDQISLEAKTRREVQLFRQLNTFFTEKWPLVISLFYASDKQLLSSNF
jgi:hypothetical protein